MTSTTPMATQLRHRVSRKQLGFQLTAATAAQLTLLAALAAVDLGLLGWLVGVGFVAGLCVLLAGAARRAGSTTLGPADLVTLARSVLVGGVAALVAHGLAGGVVPVLTLIVLAAVALALDGVDGQVARRTRTVSALGARFDMEVDSFLVLVLSIHVATTTGPWAVAISAVAIGAMRYVWVAASWMLPWLRGALPTRYSAKVVAAATGINLVVVASGLLPHTPAAVLVVATLGVLSWSFGQSVTWLWRARTRVEDAAAAALSGPLSEPAR